MRHSFLLGFSLAAVATGALAQAPAPTPSVGERSGINSMVGAAPSTQDFVTQAAISDMFEIESSKLAQQKSTKDTIKSFASQMVADHTKTSQELKSAATGVQIPADMDSSHQSKLDKLRGLNGADFDKQYISDQQSAHKDAVSLFDRYAKSGDNAGLKAWAGKTLPVLQHHKDMADKLQ